MFGQIPPQATRVPMRDGTALACDVVLPAAGFCGPTLLLRTPYGRRRFAQETRGLTVQAAGDAGFAVVAQDVRGRGGSAGTFGFVAQEGADGTDTIAWIAAQPWSDGRVAMVGASYPARAQLVLSGGVGPAPCAVVPAMAGLTSRESWWPGGVLALDLAGGWIRDLASRGPFGWEDTPDAIAVRALLDGADGAALATAALGLDHPIRRSLGPILPYLDAGAEPPRSVAAPPRAPSLHLTGWSDSMLDPTVRAWEAARRDAAAAHHIVIGPWDHRGDQLPGAQTLGFLDHAIHGIGDPPATAEVYVTGQERWCSFAAWPPLTAEHRPELTVDGLDRTGTSTAHSLFADSAHPVPALAFRPPSAAGVSPIAVDALTRRSDVLLARADPCAQAIVAAGRFTVRLDCRGEPVGAALLAKVLDIAPTGYARIVAEGIELLPATGALTITTTPAHHRWGRGHRIALLLCPSEFPRYLTGVDTDRRIVIAADGPYLSCLSIPILQRSSP